ncbi:hypothetical protein M9H77_24368 [Catharanthus roseus]|uniref:Uncharacterized protein n=1 Tax=Catharanthus roseus TaxID=4058 RepID=A0ACC0AXN3_CATRO|nr:hypothetical protein M9H77_24368 [Catharanthus roseus]
MELNSPPSSRSKMLHFFFFSGSNTPEASRKLQRNPVARAATGEAEGAAAGASGSCSELGDEDDSEPWAAKPTSNVGGGEVLESSGCRGCEEGKKRRKNRKGRGCPKIESAIFIDQSPWAGRVGLARPCILAQVI